MHKFGRGLGQRGVPPRRYIRAVGAKEDLKLVIDVVDTRMVKALSHPIRVGALALLEEQVLSPKELADKLGVALPLASYHVRQLASFGLIELVGTSPRRGTVQHYYRAKAQPRISDAAWAKMPTTVKRKLVEATLRRANSAMAQAASEGGFERADAHASRTTLQLDDRAWGQLSKLLATTLERVERIEAEATARADRGGRSEARPATVLLMLFEGPNDSGATVEP
jgi:DNA-binding transcriptional ArsR family regulator